MSQYLVPYLCFSGEVKYAPSGKQYYKYEIFYSNQIWDFLFISFQPFLILSALLVKLNATCEKTPTARGVEILASQSADATNLLSCFSLPHFNIVIRWVQHIAAIGNERIKKMSLWPRWNDFIDSLSWFRKIQPFHLFHLLFTSIYSLQNSALRNAKKIACDTISWIPFNNAAI